MALSRKSFAILLSGLIAFVISSCTDINPTQDSETLDTTNNAELPSREAIPHRQLTPFDEFRNVLWGMNLDADSQLRQLNADRVRQEDLLAQCMNDLGFEYIPWLGWNTWYIRDAENYRPDDQDWVTQYGYGWTTLPPESRGGGGISGTMDFFTPGNPNIEIFNSLSEGEQRAFWAAFQYRGSGLSRIVDGWEHINCNNWSSAVVNYERQVGNRAEFAPLMAAITQMYDDLRWEISDADRAWSNCMAESGFPGLERQWEASDTLLRELNELTTRISANPNWEPGVNPTTDNSPEMAKLRDREIKLATADLNCRISTNFEANRSAHVVSVETQFIDDHLAALTALRDAAEQGD